MLSSGGYRALPRSTEYQKLPEPRRIDAHKIFEVGGEYWNFFLDHRYGISPLKKERTCELTAASPRLYLSCPASTTRLEKSNQCWRRDEQRSLEAIQWTHPAAGQRRPAGTANSRIAESRGPGKTVPGSRASAGRIERPRKGVHLRPLSPFSMRDLIFYRFHSLSFPTNPVATFGPSGFLLFVSCLSWSLAFPRLDPCATAVIDQWGFA